MWIKASTFEQLMKERYEAQGTGQALERQVAVLNTTLDWMRVRLTQLEHERAQLIHNYMGVKIAVPEIEPSRAPASVGAEATSDIPSFNDVGDDEAKAQGLGWDAEGRATQHGKVIG